jgi:alpha-mannosidase
VNQRLHDGLTAIAPLTDPNEERSVSAHGVAAINAWSFPCTKFVNYDPLSGATESPAAPSLHLPHVPGLGFAIPNRLDISPPPVPLADGRTLRNELLEVVISETTGGIQSLRAHRDRSTRASQRLVYHDERGGRRSKTTDDVASHPQLDTQMLVDHMETIRNDAVAGEITSRGRLLDDAGNVLARFTQTVRLARGLSVVVVEVAFDTLPPPQGDTWGPYFASRLAWSDEAAIFRRGIESTGQETTRSRIEAPDWVEISEGVGRITVFSLGLPFHQRVGPTWLDTVLIAAGSERRRFQLALGLDCNYPTQSALELVTAGSCAAARLHTPPIAPRGWFLHVGAKNLIVTHVEPLSEERRGVRLRILETEGREARSSVTAFRPFRGAQITDFLGQPTELLSVVDGEVHLEIGPHRWLQIEAEW